MYLGVINVFFDCRPNVCRSRYRHYCCPGWTIKASTGLCVVRKYITQTQPIDKRSLALNGCKVRITGPLCVVSVSLYTSIHLSSVASENSISVGNSGEILQPSSPGLGKMINIVIGKFIHFTLIVYYSSILHILFISWHINFL
jgi:hypothetical protein